MSTKTSKKPCVNNHRSNQDTDKAHIIKQLSMVVCICKGIPLHKFLPKLSPEHSVEQIHKLVGSGCGGCKGRRCSPRIETLLKKLKEAQKHS